MRITWIRVNEKTIMENVLDKVIPNMKNATKCVNDQDVIYYVNNVIKQYNYVVKTASPNYIIMWVMHGIQNIESVCMIYLVT